MAGETAKAASSHRCRAAGPCNGCFDLDADTGSDRIAFSEPGVERIAARVPEPLIVSQAHGIAKRFSVPQANGVAELFTVSQIHGVAEPFGVPDALSVSKPGT